MTRRAALLTAFATLGCMGAWAKEPKLSQDLQGADSQTPLRVIVRWKHAPKEKQARQVSDLGGLLNALHPLIKAGAYTLPGSALKELANDPDVVYISPDRPVHAKLDYTAAAVDARAAWYSGWSGAGIGVAVIDSGINPDPNFSSIVTPGLSGVLPVAGGPGSRIVYSQDFVGKGARDDYGHGQHVAGIIGANGSTSECPNCTRKFIGIAPAANLLDLRVLDENGTGTDSDVIAAIEKAIELKDKYNVRVINLSLGRPVFESYTLDPLCQAVEAAWKAGIVVVVAAGNNGRDNSLGAEGYGTIDAPGNDPYVITVGAMNTRGTYGRSDDVIASYSSKGPTQIDHVVKPDLVAPGNQVVSLSVTGATLEKEYRQNQVRTSYYQDVSGTHPGHYFRLSGTSMAAPAVSGAVADLLQAKSSLTPDQVKLLLMMSAYKTFPASSTVTDGSQTYTDYYDIFTVGAGYLDLGAALASIDDVPASGTALSPIANYDDASGTVTLSYDPSSAYANRAVWNSQTVWGARAVWDSSELDDADRAVWGSKAVWGSGTDSANRAVWGSKAVWSSSTDAAAQTLNITIHGEK
jgi:serine protease AprX